jgi:tetratricopeptide (TPR) repeat protein
MTNENTESVVETDVQVEQPTFRWLPWALAGGAVLLYFLTLNHWVTVTSLAAISRVTGWNWHPANLYFRPAMLPPLYTLLTLPARWLPMDWRPVAMNLFSAVLAAAVLWELARTVKLMPQDRTREQRQRSQNDFAVLVGRNCWIPASLAVGMLGLQLTFWLNATEASGEMLDLWVFAFCFRALMEHRITGSDRWIFAMSLAYGLGVVNNWAMIAFGPVYLVAVVWMKGFGFFDIRFLAKALLFAAAGLCLYLAVPLCDSFFGPSEQPFWPTLRIYLRYQKTFLVDLPFVQAPQFRAQLFVILLASLFPLMLCSIRWGRLGGDFNPAGSAVTNLMVRLFHFFFLAAGAWVFFDPPFSPSALSHKTMPFLTSYYMTALVVGYAAGYMALVFGVEPELTWQRSSGLRKSIDRAVIGLGMLAVVALPALLFWKNWPSIRTSNSDLLAKAGSIMVESLPESGTVVLSDDPAQLMLLKAAYQRAGKTHHNLLLETSSLRYSRYLEYLSQQEPAYKKWLFQPLPRPGQAIPDLGVLRYLTNLAGANRVFYLNPSFGYFFESFYARPRGLVYELHRYPLNGDPMAPKLGPVEVRENQDFWSGQETLIQDAIRGARTASPDAASVAQDLSRALDYWGTELQKRSLDFEGTELQKLGLLREAGERFTSALQINPDNVVADINLKFNGHLQKGEVKGVEPTVEAQKSLMRFGNINGVMVADGPFDELLSDYNLGRILAEGKNSRQALQYFQRCLNLKPEWPEARLAMSKIYIDLGFPALAVKTISLLHTNSLDRPNQIELLRVESFALAESGKYEEGERLLLDALAKQRNDLNLLSVASYYYLVTSKYTNALGTLDRLLRLEPDDRWALFNKGKILYFFKRYPETIQTLDIFLNNNTKSFEPLLYRAGSYLETGQLDKARKDYESAEKLASGPYLFPVYYGLGEIAYRTKDYPAAARSFKRYLDLAPTNIPQYLEIKKRLAELPPGK